MELRHGHASAPAAADRVEKRDHLADIAQVVSRGDKPRLSTQEVLQELVKLDEAAYRKWTFERLTKFLTPLNAAPYKSGGIMKISSARVQEALTDRDENDGSEGDGGDGED